VPGKQNEIAFASMARTLGKLPFKYA